MIYMTPFEKRKLFRKKCELYRKVLPLLSKEEKENYDEWFKIDFTHNSTAIDGNRLTGCDVAQVLCEKMSPCSSVPLEHIEIVQHHADAWEYWLSCTEPSTEPMSGKEIRHIYFLLLGDWMLSSGYRYCELAVRSFSYCPPAAKEVPALMKEKMTAYAHQQFSSIAEEAAYLHMIIATVMPFQMFNGLVARMAVNELLLRKGYPAISIQVEDRVRYFKLIGEYEQTGNLWSFTEFLQENIKRTLDRFLLVYDYHLNGENYDEEKS